MNPNIVYVEDDHLEKGDTAAVLRKYGNMTSFTTELQFRQYIDALVRNPKDWPSLAVLDQNVRWTEPSPDMTTPPPDVRSEGFRYAGLRCYEYLRKAEAASQVKQSPVIIYSNIDWRDFEERVKEKGLALDENCVFLAKEENSKNLEEAIIKFLR